MLLCLCPPLSSCTNTEPSLTPHNLTTALDTLPDDMWFDFGVLIDVPRSKSGSIRSQYSSDGERKSALLHTYLTSHPAPSWLHITCALYRCDDGKQHAVLERVQRMFPTGNQCHRYAHLNTCIHSCAWYMYNTYTCTVYSDYEIHKVGKVLPNLTSLPFHSTNMYSMSLDTIIYFMHTL